MASWPPPLRGLGFGGQLERTEVRADGPLRRRQGWGSSERPGPRRGQTLGWTGTVGGRGTGVWLPWAARPGRGEAAWARAGVCSLRTCPHPLAPRYRHTLSQRSCTRRLRAGGSEGPTAEKGAVRVGRKGLRARRRRQPAGLLRADRPSRAERRVGWFLPEDASEGGGDDDAQDHAADDDHDLLLHRAGGKGWPQTQGRLGAGAPKERGP